MIRRLRFWFLVMDALFALGAWHRGSRLWPAYCWALRKASDATDWGTG